jgi:hypothetical protein
MITKLVAKVAVAGVVTAGVVAALAVALPASAADKPTITGTGRTGYGPITLSGTATPGAEVDLYESPISFVKLFQSDLYQSPDYANDGEFITTTADSAGHYEIVRNLDTGFYFATESGGVRSDTLTAEMKALPTLVMSSPSAGVVRAQVTSDPDEPGLPVQVQESQGGVWKTVASGEIADPGGIYTGTMSGLSGGTHTYRAYIGADPTNGVLANYSATQTVTVSGPVAAPAARVVVQFTKIRYDSPGKNTGSNASLNGEWARLTNKGAATVNLLHWTVRDASAHVYTFSSYNLRPGQSVTVFTGKGTAATGRRYWARTGRTGYIWNNGGDTATLRTNAGKTIDTCKWTKNSNSTAC